MARKIRNIRKSKWQWLFAMVAGVLLLAGCGGGGGGGTAPVDTADARFEFTLTSFDPIAVALSNGLSDPTSSRSAIQLVEGKILAVDLTTGEEHEFTFAVEVDPSAFQVTDIDLPLPPGTYDVFFLMTSGDFQYAAITGSWIILEGQNVVPMLIAPLIGQTVSDLDRLKRLMEFEFTFTDEEVQKLKAAANPRFSISVDGGAASIFSINPATGLTTAFAVLEAGTYVFEVTFFDGNVVISEPKEITVVVPEEGGKTKIEVNLKPSADAGLNQSVHQGDTVTLLGNESSSSGGSLTYLWSFVSKPVGSRAVLDDPTAVNPIFDTDVEGDYVLQLIVTDENGVSSDPIIVTVSTFNTTPVADPGEDEVIVAVPDMVEVDGTPSFDEDGDTFTYLWTITSKPAGSTAELDDPTSPTPTFEADLKGTYVLTLVVTDQFGAVSDEQTVTFTFENVAPVAVASTDQPSVDVGTEVTLSGAGSSDANGDPLTYMWSKTFGPDVDLTGSNDVEARFTPAEPGTYIFSLVVDDGETPSDPSNVTVVAVENDDTTIDILRDLIVAIESLDKDAFGHPHHHGGDHDGDHDEIHDHHHHGHQHSHHFIHWQHRNTLVNKVLSVIHKLDEGKLESAKKKLERDILRKTDGCGGLLDGTPDKHDWIVTCEAQVQVYPLVVEAIGSIVIP